MSNRYDVVSGRPGKDGKTNWTKIGVMFPAQNGKGFSIKLDALPLPNEKGEVWISAWEPKPRDDARSAPRGRSSYEEELSDHVPF